LCFLDDFGGYFAVEDTIAMRSFDRIHRTRSFNADLDVRNGSSGIFCKIIMMEKSWFKVRSCYEGFWMKNKITVVKELGHWY
jgi:predicted signal transduction protein with EAL and GGDEF domain